MYVSLPGVGRVLEVVSSCIVCSLSVVGGGRDPETVCSSEDIIRCRLEVDQTLIAE